MPFGSGKIWMNGTLVDWADARIHIGSHVIHYGSAVFEGARCYDTPRGTACFRLDDHVVRLLNSARIYRMDSPLDRSAWARAIETTIRENALKACYIRPIMYRGYSALGVNPLPCPVDSAILVWEWEAYLGPDAQEKGVDVCVSSWSRMAPNTFPALAKSSANYANASLIKMEAVLDGYERIPSADEVEVMRRCYLVTAIRHIVLGTRYGKTDFVASTRERLLELTTLL